jgi:hypothetical protein
MKNNGLKTFCKKICLGTMSILFFSIYTFGQNNIAAMRKLLRELQADQVSSDSFFQKGTFQSFRFNGNDRTTSKPDNNIFFTGLIGFTLKDIADRIQDDSVQLICHQIMQNAAISYPKFQHISGRPTYNFWRTNPVELFPGAKAIQPLKHINSLPDDLDDTVLFFLFQNNVSDSTRKALEKLMVASANKSKKTIKNTFKKYKQIPAYSTWFGYKMPVDFDFCVLTNVLYYRLSYVQNLNSTDSATIYLLERMIADREYLHHPAYISPHYGRPPILLYHIARLMGKYKISQLEPYRAQLIEDLHQQIKQSSVAMDKVIMHTALIWLGEKADRPFFKSFDLNNLQKTDFTFFVGCMNTYFNNPFKAILYTIPSLRFYFQCPAYNKALLLQYLSLMDENQTN